MQGGFKIKSVKREPVLMQLQLKVVSETEVREPAEPVWHLGQRLWWPGGPSQAGCGRGQVLWGKQRAAEWGGPGLVGGAWGWGRRTGVLSRDMHEELPEEKP